LISGKVGTNLDAAVILSVIATDGTRHAVEFVIDTGYTGAITLPRDIIQFLGLRFVEKGWAVMANGSIEFVDRFETFLEWDGREVRAAVESVDTAPLLGVELLNGHELRVRFVQNGDVSISPIP
jgi:clan AA aspartic protease